MTRTSLLLLATGVLVAPAAMAAVSDAEFEQLRLQVAELSQRLDALAVENAELKQSQSSAEHDATEVQADSV